MQKTFLGASVTKLFKNRNCRLKMKVSLDSSHDTETEWLGTRTEGLSLWELQVSFQFF